MTLSATSVMLLRLSPSQPVMFQAPNFLHARRGSSSSSAARQPVRTPGDQMVPCMQQDRPAGRWSGLQSTSRQAQARGQRTHVVPRQGMVTKSVTTLSLASVVLPREQLA